MPGSSTLPIQRLFWHFYLFIFLVLLGSGWAVEQLWHQWQPAAEPPWFASYTELLQQQLQQPVSTWPDAIPLAILAQPADSISWQADELMQLKQGKLVSLFDAERVYFYYLQNDQLWQLGPLELVQNDGAIWFTLLFFIFLAIAVALWLWPVARDIRTLQAGLSGFSGNTDTILRIPNRSFIAPIAQSFQHMSLQIRELLALQREMTQAVSHELRTPIARLSFALEMAQQLPDQERQLMLQDVRELQQLVDEILDYARLESGQLPLQMQHINFTELVLNVREKLSPLAGADITLQLPESAVLYGDGHYLERALQNLLVNAKKYASQRIQLTLSQQKQYWQLDIEDDGPGISENVRQHIFKPFFRVEASRNKQAGGFGLGLAIVHRIASWHQGSVTVKQSAALGGAHFILRLPLRT